MADMGASLGRQPIHNNIHTCDALLGARAQGAFPLHLAGQPCHLERRVITVKTHAEAELPGRRYDTTRYDTTRHDTM